MQFKNTNQSHMRRNPVPNLRPAALCGFRRSFVRVFCFVLGSDCFKLSGFRRSVSQLVFGKGSDSFKLNQPRKDALLFPTEIQWAEGDIE